MKIKFLLELHFSWFIDLEICASVRPQDISLCSGDEVANTAATAQGKSSGCSQEVMKLLSCAQVETKEQNPITICLQSY